VNIKTIINNRIIRDIATICRDCRTEKKLKKPTIDINSKVNKVSKLSNTKRTAHTPVGIFCFFKKYTKENSPTLPGNNCPKHQLTDLILNNSQNFIFISSGLNINQALTAAKNHERG